MPTTVHSHSRAPSVLVKMKLLSGTTSPTRQPYFSASWRPTIAPSRVAAKSTHASGGIRHSG